MSRRLPASPLSLFLHFSFMEIDVHVAPHTFCKLSAGFGAGCLEAGFLHPNPSSPQRRPPSSPPFARTLNSEQVRVVRVTFEPRLVVDTTRVLSQVGSVE
jgi:hypothetical protein